MMAILLTLLFCVQFIASSTALSISSFLRKIKVRSGRFHATPDSNLEISDKYKVWFDERRHTSGATSLKDKNYDVGYLAVMLENKKLNISPEYQRGFVWDKARSARLIETVLCQRFIPPIVLHEQANGTFDVIDGKQRLSTILSFWYGEDGARKFDLPLTAAYLQFEKSDEGEEHPLNGLCMTRLPKTERDSFGTFNIDVKIVEKNSPDDLVYDIYEDINSGADNLSAQQLRRAAFKGSYMKLIDELRKNANLKHIRNTLHSKGIDKKDLKEGDGEMILRAFAFSNSKPSESYKSPLKKFLNRDAADINKRLKSCPDNGEGEIHRLKFQFERILEMIVDIFGPTEACREWYIEDGDWKLKKEYSPYLFDGLYGVLKELVYETKEVNKVMLQKAASQIKENLKNEFKEGSFNAVRKLSKADMRKRKELLTEVILSALDIKEKRLFSRTDMSIRNLWEAQGSI
mmetsp:Transcript_20569/g.19901  ORF Transcript_20569/g.19901 Transcript_20569/m.19901 type:complete len:461 (+) Transcript_20569:141-1523(+)